MSPWSLHFFAMVEHHLYKFTVSSVLSSSVAKVVAKVPFTPGHEMVGEVRCFQLYIPNIIY